MATFVVDVDMDATAKVSVKTGGYVDAVRVSPSGQVAVAVSHITGNDWNGQLQIMDTALSTEQMVATEDGMADCAWVGASRESVATASDSGDVTLWQSCADSGSLEQVSSMEDHDDLVSSLASQANRPDALVSGSWDHK